MKSKQQLIDEWLAEDASTAYRDGFNIAITHAFSEFKERIEFYKKNKHPSRNSSYVEDIDNELIDEYHSFIHNKGYIHTTQLYNTWLFHHYFGDIK